MNTQILVRKLNKELGELKDDMKEVKRFLFAPLKDSDGKYRKIFVKRMLARSKGGGPFYKFYGKDSFLTHVRAKK